MLNGFGEAGPSWHSLRLDTAFICEVAKLAKKSTLPPRANVEKN